MSNKLMGLLKAMAGTGLSVSGDTEDILVLSNVHTAEDAENITISGIDEELGAVIFNLVKSNIATITSFFEDIEVHTTDGKLVLIEEF
jgi:hypothetical protein